MRQLTNKRARLWIHQALLLSRNVGVQHKAARRHSAVLAVELFSMYGNFEERTKINGLAVFRHSFHKGQIRRRITCMTDSAHRIRVFLGQRLPSLGYVNVVYPNILWVKMFWGENLNNHSRNQSKILIKNKNHVLDEMRFADQKPGAIAKTTCADEAHWASELTASFKIVKSTYLMLQNIGVICVLLNAWCRLQSVTA